MLPRDPIIRALLVVWAVVTFVAVTAVVRQPAVVALAAPEETDAVKSIERAEPLFHLPWHID